MQDGVFRLDSPGELFIAGDGVALGYLNRTELTAERFVSATIDGTLRRLYRTGDLVSYRPDGCLLFLGRADSQLKVRGHRIEAGAVEAALRDHAAVIDAAVTGHAIPGRSGVRLVAYVQTAENGSFDGPTLRSDLGRTLPDFMVPDTIVPLDDLPKRPNGKVDYNALPDLDDVDLDAADFVAPRTDLERTLAEIWATLLGVDRVGIDDNYFALGGDSIISIQMISRARQAGLQIEPGQVAALPTIAQLAEAAAKGKVSDAGQADAPLHGDVPLSPIQHWFFEASMPARHHWNQSNLFEVDPDLDVAALEAALRHCLQHHDMLRARFRDTEAGWQQTVDSNARLAVNVIDLDPATDPDENLLQAQARFDLDAAPLLSATLLRRADNEPALLLVAVHHLVIDVVSSSVLMDDLEFAYRRHLAGEPIELPQRTTSFADWVSALADHDWSAQRSYWAQSTGHNVSFPTDHPGSGPGDERTRQVIHAQLPEERTRALLSQANEPYHTRVEDLLVVALARTISRWTGNSTLRIDLESHGRPDDWSNVDLSRTIGWFTAAYPVTLNVGYSMPEADSIKSVKETLRAVPGDGIGYGALRYLMKDASLVSDPTPPIIFNYLSRVRDTGDTMFRRLSGAEETSRDPANTRSHLFEVVAAVRQDRLVVDWHFSTARHDAATVQHLADSLISDLERIIEHCLAPDAGGFTPSDFPEAGLDQSELDSFLDGITE